MAEIFLDQNSCGNFTGGFGTVFNNRIIVAEIKTPNADAKSVESYKAAVREACELKMSQKVEKIHNFLDTPPPLGCSGLF